MAPEYPAPSPSRALRTLCSLIGLSHLLAPLSIAPRKPQILYRRKPIENIHAICHLRFQGQAATIWQYDLYRQRPLLQRNKAEQEDQLHNDGAGLFSFSKAHGLNR